MKFLKLKNKLILAPMAGVTDLAFRILCRKQGAALAYTEMVSAESLVRENRKSNQIILTDKQDVPLGIQLFGNNPKTLLEAAEIAEKHADLIDINLGCPAPKLTKQEMGSALLKDNKKVEEIVSVLVQNLKVPVTVKIRSGYSKQNYIETAKACEKAGASALTIHPRLAKQGYSGKADWNVIKEIKENVLIPVIGNGDVVKPEDVKKMLETTGCDYVMIGRAAIGNPFIFSQSLEYLNKGKYLAVEPKEKINGFFEYLKLASKYGINSEAIKQHALWFTSGVKGSRKIRAELTKSKSTDELKDILGKLI